MPAPVMTTGASTFACCCADVECGEDVMDQFMGLNRFDGMSI